MVSRFGFSRAPRFDGTLRCVSLPVFLLLFSSFFSAPEPIPVVQPKADPCQQLAGSPYRVFLKERGGPLWKVEKESLRSQVWHYLDVEAVFREGVLVSCASSLPVIESQPIRASFSPAFIRSILTMKHPYFLTDEEAAQRIDVEGLSRRLALAEASSSSSSSSVSPSTTSNLILNKEDSPLQVDEERAEKLKELFSRQSSGFFN